MPDAAPEASIPEVLALSPHLDDAAFSCGGTLARLADAGWRVSVATLFTASVPDPRGFALACQLDKGLPAEADYMAIRRAEDAAACAALGAAPLWLPLREAPHRGYESAPALFGPPLDPDPAEAALLDTLATLLRERRPALLLAPQAIGGHVDHVLLVRALRALQPAAPVLWWRDFPYTARSATPPQPFADSMDVLPEWSAAVDPARKQRACAAYRTQLGFQFGGEAGLARALAAGGTHERFRTADPAALPALEPRAA
ncbi:PIG-L deacetylase family protein [Roseomonas sp. BN140053]|uniref:PIG-L deacetylase family protein n=1 Tax=Roseomonas sp. BN140053 TaxID=3391898 RepID=UPI0039E84E63